MRFVSFTGRIDRQTFFVSMLVLYGLAIVFAMLTATGIVTLAVDVPAQDNPAQDIPDLLRGVSLPKGVGWVCLIVGLLGLLWIILATVGVSVRRLHDVGLTGFLVLVYPLLKHVVPDAGWPDWLPGLVDILWIVILTAQPGTRGPNAFGPAPYEPPAGPAES